MNKILEAANEADIIVNGYAYKNIDGIIHALNLNNPDKAVVFSEAMEVYETSMDDIEISIVLEYYNKNKKYILGGIVCA